MKTPTDYKERNDYLIEAQKIKQAWQETMEARYQEGIWAGLMFGAALGLITAALLFNYLVGQ